MERFSRLKKIYLKIACFVIGYEYSLISECSVLSIKNLKKYFYAVNIIAVIWFFIGFNFSQIYIKLNLIGSIIGGLIASIVIINIEKQIILTIGKNWTIVVTRFLLGLLIACIGATIIDQIIFKDDIEKTKLEDDQKEVARLVPLKTKELEEELNRFKENIQKLSNEREELLRTINEKPFIENRTTVREYGIDTTRKRRFEKGGSEQITQVINPNIERVKLVEEEIRDLQNKMSETNQKKINVRKEVENEVKSKKGFLTEIGLLLNVAFSSTISTILYIMFIALFFVIELLVILIKFTSKMTDYEYKVQVGDTIKKEQVLRALDADMRDKINKEIRK